MDQEQEHEPERLELSAIGSKEMGRNAGLAIKPKAAAAMLSVGDRVLHMTFGGGMVISVKDMGRRHAV